MPRCHTATGGAMPPPATVNKVPRITQESKYREDSEQDSDVELTRKSTQAAAELAAGSAAEV